MKTLSLFFSLCLLSGLTKAQSHKFEWAHSTGSAGVENTHSIATDKDGNVYTSGRFRNTFDFDPGPGTATLTAASTIYDLFISKFDKDGNFVWVKQLGGSGYKTDAYLTLDTANNIYMTGALYGKMDLDPGAGTFEMTADTTQDIFVAKYNQDGDFIWAKQMGGFNSYSTPKAITTDDFGNVYTTGTFADTIDFDPGPGIFQLNSVGYIDFYISKLDKDGDFAWAKAYGYTDSNAVSFSIAADRSGNTYTVGSFTGIIDFDPGAGVSELSAARPQTFILKLDIAGDFAWARQLENKGSVSRSSNTPSSATVDQSGDLYIAGNFTGLADFDPGTTEHLLTTDLPDAYVLKLSKDGDFVWANQVGGVMQDYAICIRTDDDGNSYLAGNYFDGGDFDPGPGKFMLQSAGQQDIFIVKLDKSGSFIWAKSMGGKDADLIAMIALDKDQNLYSAGDFRGTADFNPGTAVAGFTSKGSSDLFLQKMSPCTPSVAPEVFTANFCKSYTFGDITYTKPGIYKQMLSNKEGCDSIVTLELTTEVIIDPDTFTASFCVSYTFGDVTYTKAGIYTQTLSNSKGCDSIVTLELTSGTVIDPDTITIGFCASYTFDGVTYTKAGIYTQSLSSKGCDSIVTLKLTNDPIIDMAVTKSGNTLKAVTAGKTYQWVECPSMDFVLGATGQSFTPAKNGTYAVIVYVHPCRYTSDCISVTGLGIDETISAIKATVYPSPAKDAVTLSTKEELKQASLNLTNLQGQIVLSKENISGKLFELDLSGQASGVYFLKILSAGQAAAVVKIIKE